MTAPTAATAKRALTTPATLWRGTTTLQPGRLVFAGAVAGTDVHAHAAIQILVVTTGQVELADTHGTRAAVHAAIIPTRARHAVQASPDATATMIYVDPASTADNHLVTELTGGGRDRVQGWAAAAHTILPPAADLPGALTALLRGYGTPHPVRHPVLRAALELLPNLLASPVRLADLAAAVGLSASRLGHLFAAELALPFPAYLRWARLRRALELAREGASLTQAAHGAGFADSSHLTRVCREMFGLAPSHLLHAIGPDTADAV